MTNLLVANETLAELLKYCLIAFLLLGVIFVAIIILMPAKSRKFVKEKIKNYFNKHKTFGEILRFLIVGSVATLVDMFFMGVTMFAMQKNIYPNFLNVFFNSPKPSTLATVIGTAVGFCVGLIVNYVLSILFVFNEKGKSKTKKGFVIFTVLSLIGLLINMCGMYLGYDILKLNQWVVKIIMTIVVLIYNYVTRKLLLFKKEK